MKICKHCMNEIDKKVKVCPNCRKKQNSKKIIAIPIIILFVVALSSNLIENLSGYRSSNNDSGFKSDIDNLLTEKFTLSVLEGKIEGTGYTYVKGTITNNKNKTYQNVKIEYKIYNENREQTGTVFTTIHYINPNETLEFNATGMTTYTANSNIGEGTATIEK